MHLFNNLYIPLNLGTLPELGIKKVWLESEFFHKPGLLIISFSFLLSKGLASKDKETRVPDISFYKSHSGSKAKNPGAQHLEWGKHNHSHKAIVMVSENAEKLTRQSTE